MFDLGMQEIIVVCVVALLVFGPKRLPELARAIGKVMGQLRSAMADVKTEVDREIHMTETDIDLKELPAWQKKDQSAASKNESAEGDFREQVNDAQKEADKQDA